MSKVSLIIVVVIGVAFWSERTQAAPASAYSRGRNRNSIFRYGGVRRSNFFSAAKSRLRRNGSNGAIVLGTTLSGRKYLPSSDSLLVFGPTRSGKTLTLALPLLKEFRGPAVVTSVKRDLLQRSIAFRQAKGECHVFDLSDPASSPWNLFSLVLDFRSAKEVSDSLCGVTRSKTAEIDFWSQLGSKMLAPLLLAAKEFGKPLLSIVRWIESQDFESAFEVLTTAGQYEARSALEGVLQLDQRAVSSVVATLLSLLEPYSDPVVSDLLSRDGIELPLILDRSKSNTLYLCSPLFRAERFFGIYEIFMRKVFEVAYLASPNEPKVLFLLDELANIAPIGDLDKIASTCSGYGIVLISIFQDLTQMSGIYGSRAATVVNNHRSKLYLSGITDHATLDYVEKIASRSLDSGNGTNPLLILQRGGGLLIQANAKPLQLRLRRFPR